MTKRKDSIIKKVLAGLLILFIGSGVLACISSSNTIEALKTKQTYNERDISANKTSLHKLEPILIMIKNDIGWIKKELSRCRQL